MSVQSYSPTTKKFLKTFGLLYPIIQSPMSGLSTPQLAARVTSVGGLGSLPMGGNISNIESIKKTITAYEENAKLDSSNNENFSIVTKNGNKKVNLNFFCHEEPIFDNSKISDWSENYRTYFDEFYAKSPHHSRLPGINDDLKIINPYGTFKSIDDVSHPLIQFLQDYKPLMISFHFGLPDVSIVNYLTQNGINVFVSVTNPLEFLKVRQKYKSIKGFILQNYSAGGHRGNFIANDPNDSNLGLKQLSSEINKVIDREKYQDSHDLSIILAGGICEKEQIKEIFSNNKDDLFTNVSAVQLGTAFFLDDSLNHSPNVKNLLIDIISNEHTTDNYSTIVTHSISGRNLRTFKTSFIERLVNDMSSLKVPDYPLPYSIFKKLVSKDKSVYGAYLIGSNFQNIPMANGDQVVKELFEGFECQKQ